MAVEWGGLEAATSDADGMPALLISERADGAAERPDSLAVWSLPDGQEVAVRSFNTTGSRPYIDAVAVGNLTGDDAGDIVLGAHVEGGGGEVHILRAPLSSGSLGEETLLIAGPAGANLGKGLMSIPDRDGDGTDELLAEGDAAGGAVFLIDVPDLTSGAAQFDDHILTGEDDSYVGGGVYAAGDLDGDGLADAMVDGGSKLLLIPSHWEWPSVPADVPASIEGMTDDASSTGDANGDGHDDVLVVPGVFGAVEDDRAVARVYAGPFTGVVSESAWVMELRQDDIQYWSGPSVSPSPDLEEDGRTDWILGDLAALDVTMAHQSYTVFRLPGGLCGSWTLGDGIPALTSDVYDDGFGTGAVMVPDLDGDGVEDLVMDSWDALYVFSGTVFSG